MTTKFKHNDKSFKHKSFKHTDNLFKNNVIITQNMFSILNDDDDNKLSINYPVSSNTSNNCITNSIIINNNINNDITNDNITKNDITKNDIIKNDITKDDIMGNNLQFNTYWTVWIHHNNSTNWTLNEYQKIYIINSIGSFWRFFCNFKLLNKYDNIFIMREEIAPIWEDVNNKFGGICSIKINSIFKDDISLESLILIILLIINETFIPDGKNINGITLSIKYQYTLLKIWTKKYIENNDFINDLPISLFDCIDSEYLKINKHNYNYKNKNKDNKITLIYKKIKPDF